MNEQKQNKKTDALRLLEETDRALARIFVNQDAVLQMSAARLMLKQAHEAVAAIPEQENKA